MMREEELSGARLREECKESIEQQIFLSEEFPNRLFLML